MLGVIRRSFQFLDNRISNLLFKGMVRVHLEYAAPVWSPANIGSIENIEKVQRRGTKAFPGMKDLTYEQRIRSLNLPSLRFRRYRGDMIEVFKITKWFYDTQCVPSLNVKNEIRRTRGHSLQLQTGRPRLELTKKSFCHSIIPVWNSLSQEVMDSSTINQFKNRLDRYWSEKKCKFGFHYNILDEQDLV